MAVWDPRNWKCAQVLYVCVCVCARARARACVRACMRACVDCKGLQVLEDHSGEVVGLAWHPHGSVLATGSADMTVNLYPLRCLNFSFYFQT